MVFNSVSYMLAFAAAFALYWAIPPRCRRIRNAYLLIASYAFYMIWNPFYALILLWVTLATYFVAGLIEGREEKSRERRMAICLSLLCLLPLL